MQHAFKVGDTDHAVALSRGRGSYRLHVGDARVAIDLATAADGRTWLVLDGRRVEVVIATRGDDVFVHLDGEAHALRYEHPLDRLAAQAAGGANDRIRAPMPGSIVSASVKSGDAVAKGQTLLVMESMKMETTLVAPRDGIVADVPFGASQTFERDAILVRLEAVAGEGA